MQEYKLTWYANSGAGESFAMESEVPPAAFDAAWQTALDTVLVESEDQGPADPAVLTRDQFRKVIKALEATGQFHTAVPREVVNRDFRTGKGWDDK